MVGSDDPYGNIHVFGPGSPELVRHVVFQDWLRTRPADRERYVAAERLAATVATDETSRSTPAAAHDVAGRLDNLRK